MINFNGDDVDCILEREVADEIMKLLFLVVDETCGAAGGRLIIFVDEDGVVDELELKIVFVSCKTG